MQTLLRCMHTLAGHTGEKYWTFRAWKWHAVVSRSISKLILQTLPSDTQCCGILHLVKNSSTNVSPCETSLPFLTWVINRELSRVDMIRFKLFEWAFLVDLRRSCLIAIAINWANRQILSKVQFDTWSLISKRKLHQNCTKTAISEGKRLKWTRLVQFQSITLNQKCTC